MAMATVFRSFTLLLLLGLAVQARHETKGARISLHATWPATPLLHEAAEFLADEDAALFWSFAASWAAPGEQGPAQCWERIVEAASRHLSPSVAKILPISLGMRQYSPRLEVFSQLGQAADPAAPRDACCWATVGGKVALDSAGVEAAVAAALSTPPAAPAAVHPFDHAYHSATTARAFANISDARAIPAILYGPLGGDCTAALHAALQAAADRHGELLYVWRPVLGGGCAGQAHVCGALGSEGPLALPGYGVEMAIKNMEYNARDDGADKAQAADAPAAPSTDEGGLDEVAGFKFDVLLGRKPALRQELLTFRDHLAAAASQEQVLKVWDLKDLGVQATQRVAAAADPLHLLGEVAQNFPLLVEALSRVAVDRGVREAVGSLSRMVPPEAQFLLLNGVVYDPQDFDLHDFVAALRREARLADALAAVGLSPEGARAVAVLRGKGSEGGGEGAAATPRLDLRPGAGEVAWVNDLENDAGYGDMPRRLDSLLQPTFPGQLPSVRRNVFTALYLFDPGSPQSLELALTVHDLHTQHWPLRFGLMPVTEQHGVGGVTAPGPKLARLFALVAATHGGGAAAEFLAACAEEKELGVQERFGKEAWAVAERVFKAKWAKWAGGSRGSQGLDEDAAALSPEAALQQAVSGTGVGQLAARFLQDAWSLAHRKGVARTALTNGLLVFNGVVSAGEDGAGWRQLTISAWQPELQAVATAVYSGTLRDSSTDLLGDVLALHGTVPRYNPRIMPSEQRSSRSVRLFGAGDELPARQVALAGPLLGPRALASLPLMYFGPETAAVTASEDDYEEAEPAPGVAAVTHWVVADPGSRQGLALVAAGMQHVSSSARVGILLNRRDASAALSPVELVVGGLAAGLLPDASRADLVDLVNDLSQEQRPGALTATQLTRLVPEGLLPPTGGVEALLASLQKELPAAVARHSEVVQLGLQLPAGRRAVVTNGRVLELREPQDEVQAEDFALLDLNAQRTQHAGGAVLEVVAALEVEVGAGSDAAAAISSILSTYQPEEVDGRSAAIARVIEERLSQPNAIHVAAEPAPAGDAGHSGPAPLLVQAILDPLSKRTQQLSGVLTFLRSHLGPDIQVVLNPQREYGDLPLKTFYRYVTPTTTGAAPPPAASFASLPPHKTLTLGMDVPEGWLVEPVVAAHDLDNLRLEELPPGVKTAEAVFELEALLVTGMCVDAAAVKSRQREGVHPRGVQLWLGTQAQPHVVDTLVMSNLGYFQLKAAPGVWDLRLAPGRSQELYDVAAAAPPATPGQAVARTPTDVAPPRSPGHPVSLPVAVTGFSAKDMLLVLKKRPDRLTEDVLDAEEGSGQGMGAALWGKLGGVLKGGPVADGGGGGGNETIHVFTVASGHMYERLQKIMILSAHKRTSAHLKFWFIKNYMSPQMKAFVPIMARAYGFDYEFVTYKWPSWLHKQTEKQRIIWAYKILFLDVLFPLGLKKVIFCDSDQVIRADLAELWHHDLGGAPYGYTPFCDTNPDMEGFRFWKQGFWRDHLRGRPYHISALYVVDLERFRQMAAGDRLRIIYDGLSKDPNSLANLDQDLPNYAQEGVPIASLPQEWLWCETWCGEASRPAAKTIDLCNNPLTKEPKLQSARRIIAEWPDLDREAREFTERAEAVLAGALSEEQLGRDQGRFVTFLEPMVEGSVRTQGGKGGEAARAEAPPAGRAPAQGVVGDAGEATPAHDNTEL